MQSCQQELRDARNLPLVLWPLPPQWQSRHRQCGPTTIPVVSSRSLSAPESGSPGPRYVVGARACAFSLVTFLPRARCWCSRDLREIPSSAAERAFRQTGARQRVRDGTTSLSTTTAAASSARLSTRADIILGTRRGSSGGSPSRNHGIGPYYREGTWSFQAGPQTEVSTIETEREALKQARSEAH